jgi:subtilisin family serine protease
VIFTKISFSQRLSLGEKWLILMLANWIPISLEMTSLVKYHIRILGLAIICFFLSDSTFSQQKYYIYFKDKGIKTGEFLSKSSFEYQKALDNLSPRSIDRRIKNMGEENIITYDDLPIEQNYVKELILHGVKIQNELTWFNAVTTYLTESQRNTIRKLSFIDKIETVRVFRFKRNEMISSNYLVKETASQDQIKYGSSFTQLNLSGIPTVHEQGITGDGVLIGILDTGFKWKEHESLVNAKVIAEYDFMFKDSVTADQPEDLQGQHNHGTAVFSVIGGYKDSTLIGAAYNSSFVLGKTEDVRSETRIEEDYYAAALIWMESLGVDITTSSLGYNIFDDSVYSYTYSDMDGKTTVVTKAAELAFQRGVVTVTAAGNEGNNSWFHIIAPGDGFNTTAVGAVSYDTVLAYFSSRGPTADGRIKPDIVAQGVGVFSASASGYSFYNYVNGTSMATPIAAGVAALLLSAHPYLKNTQVRNILLESAGNFSSPNNEIGYGLVSAADAISYPNLNNVNDVNELNKIFINENGVNTSSVKLNYTVNGKDYTSQDMLFDGVMRFTAELPVQTQDQLISFYFSFSDTMGNILREPDGNTTYKFKYGDLNIYHNSSIPLPQDYDILSQNYPNPFNSKTTIKFIAASVEPAELIIIDAIGQKVKTLFKGLTKIGENTIQWNGFNDSGLAVSSGVYIYILKLSGAEYGKKMILLK